MYVGPFPESDRGAYMGLVTLVEGPLTLSIVIALFKVYDRRARDVIVDSVLRLFRALSLAVQRSERAETEPAQPPAQPPNPDPALCITFDTALGQLAGQSRFVPPPPPPPMSDTVHRCGRRRLRSVRCDDARHGCPGGRACRR